MSETDPATAEVEPSVVDAERVAAWVERHEPAWHALRKARSWARTDAKVPNASVAFLLAACARGLHGNCSGVAFDGSRLRPCTPLWRWRRRDSGGGGRSGEVEPRTLRAGEGVAKHVLGPRRFYGLAALAASDQLSRYVAERMGAAGFDTLAMYEQPLDGGSAFDFTTELCVALGSERWPRRAAMLRRPGLPPPAPKPPPSSPSPAIASPTASAPRSSARRPPCHAGGFCLQSSAPPRQPTSTRPGQCATCCSATSAAPRRHPPRARPPASPPTGAARRRGALRARLRPVTASRACPARGGRRARRARVLRSRADATRPTGCSRRPCTPIVRCSRRRRLMRSLRPSPRGRATVPSSTPTATPTAALTLRPLSMTRWSMR